MKTFAYGSFALGLGIIAALLGACSGSQPAPGFEPYAARAGQAHPDRGKSWMAPGAKSIKALLYVSDIASGDIFVYDYKKGTLVGKLTGVESPYGQCVDKKGNVWITSVSPSLVVEYAHGGTSPLRTLSTDSSPFGCSVDPATGNLAVAGSSSVDVFTHARGQKQSHGSAMCYPFWAPGYDNHGNLYVQGLLYGSLRPLTGYSDPLACELPRGGTALRPVHYNNFLIVYPGSVMWDGKHLTLTDQDYKGSDETAIVRVKEDASGNLTAIGQTVLTDACDANGTQIPQPFIVGKVVVGGNLRCRYYGSGATFDYWAYPAGGAPTSTLQSPPAQPEGESVSIVR